jgi:hypothetical protein
LTEDKVLVLSLNILADHLITGECPGYKYVQKDKEEMLAHRLRVMKHFLNNYIDNTGGEHPAVHLDVLCLQEASDDQKSTFL